MTQKNHASQESAVKSLLEFWSDWIEESQAPTKVVFDSMRGAGDLTELRRLWLESLGKSLESYMRTPAFLEAMRRQFEGLTQLKQNSDAVARDLFRLVGLPRSEEISELFESLASTQRMISSRLTAIEERLALLERPGKRGKEPATN